MRSIRLTPIQWVILSAAFAFILGLWGYLRVPSSSGGTDAAYRTWQLFAVDSDIGPGAPWQLQVARFLAPLTLAGTASLVAAAFLRDQVQRALIAVLARDHVVVVGLSSSAGAIARSAIDNGRRVVLVEADRSHTQLSGLRAIGALTVIGDARQDVILQRAQLHRAKDIIVTAGDDLTNLAIADRLRALRQARLRKHATVHVAVDDPALWLEVGQLAFDRNTQTTSIECFNRADLIAQKLVDAAFSGQDLARVTIVGHGPTAERAAVRVRRRAQLRGHLIEVSPELHEDVPLVMFCGEPTDLAEAIAVLQSQPLTRVVAAVAVDRDQTLVELLGSLADRLIIVPTLAPGLASGLLTQSATELMARAKHEDYLEQEALKGLTQADNPSLLSWDELPESLRDSNRRFATSVAGTMRSLGFHLQPLREGDPGPLGLTESNLEDLAIAEHDRWQSDLRADGWTHSPSVKDPVAKTHPLLVPWDELDEEEREKDRDAIRAIPRMLAHVGYSLASRSTPRS